MKQLLLKLKMAMFLTRVRRMGGVTVFGYQDCIKRWVYRSDIRLSEKQEKMFNDLVQQGRIIKTKDVLSTPLDRQYSSYTYIPIWKVVKSK